MALFVFFATWVCQPQDTGAKAPAYIEDERKSYDKIYSTERETFSAEPNAFLVRMISGRKPGRALDVAMGQGRNSIWLASQGWSVMGFDVSPVEWGVFLILPRVRKSATHNQTGMAVS